MRFVKKNPKSAIPAFDALASTASADDLPRTGPALKRASFRAFGGGETLCPGRHFASSTILAVVAIVVLRFDITPVSGRFPPLSLPRNVRRSNTLYLSRIDAKVQSPVTHPIDAKRHEH